MSHTSIRSGLTALTAVVALALIGTAPQASAAEETMAPADAPPVVAALQSFGTTADEQPAAPAETSILLAADQQLAPSAYRPRRPVLTEPPASPTRKAARIVRSKPRPAPTLIRVASRFDFGHRSYGFVGVGFGF